MLKETDLRKALQEHFILRNFTKFKPDTIEIEEIEKFVHLLESREILKMKGEVAFWTNEYYKVKRELVTEQTILENNAVRDYSPGYKYIAIDFTIEEHMNMEKVIGQSVWGKVKDKIGRRATVYYKVWD